MSKQFVLTYVAENVSRWKKDETHFGDCVEHFNVPWKILSLRGDGKLEVYIYCMKPLSDEPFSIKTKITMRLTSINGKVFSKRTSYCFGIPGGGYGFNIFLDWNVLESDYLVNDSMVLEADVTIEKMEGVVGRKVRSFDESTKELADTVLDVEGKKFYVLKQYLAGQSPVFKSLLLGQFRESKQSEVTLKDVDSENFQKFLEVIHMEPALNDSCIEGVLQISDMFDVKNASRLCEEYLVHSSKHSLKSKIRLAARYKLENLKSHVLGRLTNKAQVRSVLGPDLKELDPSLPEELIQKLMSFN